MSLKDNRLPFAIPNSLLYRICHHHKLSYLQVCHVSICHRIVVTDLYYQFAYFLHRQNHKRHINIATKQSALLTSPKKTTKNAM